MCKLVSAIAAFGLVLWSLQHLFVVNTTESFPPGLYRKILGKEPRKGDLVLLCPPDWPIFQEALQRRYLSPGLCPSGTGYMIKQFAAGPGDYVEISSAGVSVNSELLENSKRIIDMAENTQFTARKLKQNEVLLMSPHPQSFDGRYIGPMPKQCLKSVLHPEPLYSWKE